MVKVRIGAHTLSVSAKGIRPAERKTPKSFESLMRRAQEFEQRGDEQGALNCYDRALKINPRSMDALYNKASSLLLLGRSQEAIRFFSEVVAEGSQNNAYYYPALNDRAALSMVARDIPSARRDLLKIFAAAPDDDKAIAAINLGGISETPEEALPYFEFAVNHLMGRIGLPKLRDQYYMALFFKGIALCHLGRREEGVKCIRIVSTISNPYQMQAEQILYTLARQK